MNHRNDYLNHSLEGLLQQIADREREQVRLADELRVLRAALYDAAGYTFLRYGHAAPRLTRAADTSALLCVSETST